MSLIEHYRLTRTVPPDYQAQANTSWGALFWLGLFDALVIIALVAVWSGQ